MSITSHHHILLIGGSGVCGLIFIRAALDAGHRLTLYLRNPTKLPDDLSVSGNLDVIKGELGDVEGLKKAAACGADTFISFAGPTLGKWAGTPITEALKLLYSLLIADDTTTRIIVLSTPSYSAPEDKRSFKWFMSIQFYVRPMGADSYKEMVGIAEETVALGDKIDWTVFRIPLLRGTKLEEKDRDIAAAFVGDAQGHDGLMLDRSPLVRWVLKEVDEKKWVGKCPMLSNV